MKIEIEREDDGRWIAEVPDLSGVMVHGETREEAIARVQSLALRVIADRLDVLSRPNWRDYVFAFHDRDEIGSRMLTRVAKRTGLKSEDL
jgi:predicted RNase H-like HicB family nuclease